MIDPGEAAAALYGIWRIIRCDEKAVTYYKSSVSGFWNSFTAAFVLAPLQALYQVTVYLASDAAPSLMRLVTIESLEYVILWLLFPLVMFHVTQLIDRERFFLRYVVAYNWFQLGIGLIIMPWVILAGFNLIPSSIADFASTVSFVAYTFYAAFLARIGLNLTVGTAIGIVLIDLLITLLVAQITSSLV